MQITPEPIIQHSVSQTARPARHKVGNLVRVTASHRILKLIRLRQEHKAGAIHLRHVPAAGVTLHQAGVLPPPPGHPGVFHRQVVAQVGLPVVEAVVQEDLPVVEVVVAEGNLNL